MLRNTLAVLLAAPLFAACQSGLPLESGDHWTVDSMPARMMKRFTGYRRDLDGSFIDFQYQKKQSINNTLRRHFLNSSSDNPFEPNDASQTKRRPPHSPAPDPLYYFHAESIFMGIVTLCTSGAFIPIPVDSVVATVCGGWDEFGAGFTKGAGGNAANPPSNGDFKVKNH